MTQAYPWCASIGKIAVRVAIVLISRPVSLLAGLLAGLFSHLRVPLSQCRERFSGGSVSDVRRGEESGWPVWVCERSGRGECEVRSFREALFSLAATGTEVAESATNNNNDVAL